MNATSSLLRLTRGGQTALGPIGDDVVTFDLMGSQDKYSVVATAFDEDEGENVPIVVQVRHPH